MGSACSSGGSGTDSGQQSSAVAVVSPRSPVPERPPPAIDRDFSDLRNSSGPDPESGIVMSDTGGSGAVGPGAKPAALVSRSDCRSPADDILSAGTDSVGGSRDWAAGAVSAMTTPSPAPSTGDIPSPHAVVATPVQPSGDATVPSHSTVTTPALPPAPTSTVPPSAVTALATPMTPVSAAGSSIGAGPGSVSVQSGPDGRNPRLPVDWDQPVPLADAMYTPPHARQHLDRLPLGLRETLLQGESVFARYNLHGAWCDPALSTEKRATLLYINLLRDALGLPLWSYGGSRLNAMADAHCRYVLARAKAGLPSEGHFEDPSFEAYSPEGDEAARTSGLAFSPTALLSLHSLLGGPFHRGGFLSAEARAVGIGHRHSEHGRCGLFPSRSEGAQPGPSPSGRPPYDPARFVVFPPPDWTDTGPKFGGEWPDPRPDPTLATGALLTVMVRQKRDLDAWVDSRVWLHDDTDGCAVEVIRTDPRHPSRPTMPAEELERIYGPGSNKNADMFQSNAWSAIALPVKPLQPGHHYSVRFEIDFAPVASQRTERETIAWSFRTRPAAVWQVDAEPQPPVPPARSHHSDAVHSLSYVMRAHQPGDAVLLGPGTHYADGQWVRGWHVSGSGMAATKLVLGSRVTLSGGTGTVQCMTVGAHPDLGDDAGTLFWVDSGTRVVFRRVRFSGSLTVSLGTGASVEFRECDFSRLTDGYRFVFRHARASCPVTVHGDNYFGDRGAWMYSQEEKEWEALRRTPWTWDVQPVPCPAERTLERALRHALGGDRIECAAGTYEIARRFYLKESLTVVGAAADGDRGDGAGVTILRPAPALDANEMLMVAEGKQLTLCRLTVDLRNSHKRALWVSRGAQLSLEECAVLSEHDDDRLVWCSDEAQVTLRRCDLSHCVAKILVGMGPGGRCSCSSADGNRFGYMAPRVHTTGEGGGDRELRTEPAEWPVQLVPSHPSRSLVYALKHALSGDTVLLPPGTFTLDEKLWTGQQRAAALASAPFAGLTVRGAAGAERTTLVLLLREADEHPLCVGGGCGLALVDLTLAGQADSVAKRGIYVAGNAELLLQRVRLTNWDPSGAALLLGPRSALRLESVDLRDYTPAALAWITGGAEGDNAPRVTQIAVQFGLRNPKVGAHKLRQSPIEWHVRAEAVAGEPESLQHALASAGVGDVIVLAPGRYERSAEQRIDGQLRGVRLCGAGGAATVLARAAAFTGHRMLVLSEGADLTLADLTLDNADADCDVVYMFGGARLLLEGVRLVHCSKASLLTIKPGASAKLVRCDLSEFEHSSLAYLEGPDAQCEVETGGGTRFGCRNPVLRRHLGESRWELIDTRTEPAEWPVEPVPSQPSRALLTAASSCREGDTLVLAPGRYELSAIAWFPGKRLVLRGGGDTADAVVLARASGFTADRMIGVRGEGRLALQHMTLDLRGSDKDLAWVASGGQLRLCGCRVLSDNALVACVAAGAVLELAQCDLGGFASEQLAYLSKGDGGKPDAEARFQGNQLGSRQPYVRSPAGRVSVADLNKP